MGGFGGHLQRDPINSDVEPLDGVSRARAAANRAMELEPTLAEAQHARGYISHFLEWDWLAAEQFYRRSITINPGLGRAYRNLAHLHSQMRRHDEARRCAGARDPLDPITHALSSQVAFQARDFAAAPEDAQRAVALDPEFWIGYVQQAQAYEHLGKMDLAMDDLVPAARFSGGNSKTISFTGHFLASIGKTDEARGSPSDAASGLARTDRPCRVRSRSSTRDFTNLTRCSSGWSSPSRRAMFTWFS